MPMFVDINGSLVAGQPLLVSEGSERQRSFPNHTFGGIPPRLPSSGPRVPSTGFPPASLNRNSDASINPAHVSGSLSFGDMALGGDWSRRNVSGMLRVPLPPSPRLSRPRAVEFSLGESRPFARSESNRDNFNFIFNRPLINDPWFREPQMPTSNPLWWRLPGGVTSSSREEESGANQLSRRSVLGYPDYADSELSDSEFSTASLESVSTPWGDFSWPSATRVQNSTPPVERSWGVTNFFRQIGQAFSRVFGVVKSVLEGAYNGCRQTVGALFSPLRRLFAFTRGAAETSQESRVARGSWQYADIKLLSKQEKETILKNYDYQRESCQITFEDFANLQKPVLLMVPQGQDKYYIQLYEFAALKKWAEQNHFEHPVMHKDHIMVIDELRCVPRVSFWKRWWLKFWRVGAGT